MALRTTTIPPFLEQTEVEVAHAADGPLAGLDFGVKDIFDVAGYVTGCGNPARRAEARPAKAHAAVVTRPLDAGARFAGKTHTVEFAFGMDGTNDHYGTPANPAAPGRVPGGSSSGSVSAVAAGLVDFALGSDTGGSVRGPASFCGLVGLRTTFGRIPVAGTLPLAESFDTVGWFARDLHVYRRVGAVLLGPDPDGAALTRLLVADDAFALIGTKERAALDTALSRIVAAFASAEHVTLAPEGLAAWRAIFRTVQGYEAWHAHRDWIAAHPGALSATVAGRFEAASRVSEADYRAAGDARRQVTDRIVSIVGDDGVLAIPTMPSAAPRIDSDDAALEAFRAEALSLTAASGLSGLPQISLPLAEVDGAPLGLSLIGPRHRDLALIDLADRLGVSQATSGMA